MGELAAAYTADVLTLATTMKIACCQAILTRVDLPTGRMAIVNLTKAETRDVLHAAGGRLSIAVDLSPSTHVICGEEAAITETIRRLQKAGVRCGLASMKSAFHSRNVDALRPSFLNMLRSVVSSDESVPIYSSVTGNRKRGKDFGLEYWWQIFREPSYFCDLTRSLLRDGYRIFLEVGPHPTLLPHVIETARSLGVDAVTMCTMRREQDERVTFREALEVLRAKGVRGTAIHGDRV
jgi:acyl transferase domain-containing protein